jgi:hypothetical protein
MSTVLESTLLDELLDIIDCMTPDVARRFASLRAGPAVQARFDHLAERCNEGTLSPAESDEYALLRTLDAISILHLKACNRMGV